jgi:hypothetical protein
MREAKAIAPSAWAWAAGVGSRGSRVQDVVDHAAVLTRLARTAVRSRDPGWSADGPWLIRRLAPDCSRIELADLPVQRDERHLLHAMGAETANAHLATGDAARSILADLGGRPDGWLAHAADAMAGDLRADHRVWVAHATDDAQDSHRPR